VNVSETRTKYGFSHRTLVGIGHSFGGGLTYEEPRFFLCRRDTHSSLPRALAAADKPILFSSLVLVDPATLPPPPPGRSESWAEAFGVYPTIKDFIDGALTRRSVWKSSKFVALGTDSSVGCTLTGKFRAHALKRFKKMPWFAAWDPLALEVYVDGQIYEDKSAGEAKLKTAGVWVCTLSPPAMTRGRFH